MKKLNKNPKKRYVEVKLQGVARLFSLIEAAGHAETLKNSIPKNHETAIISTGAYSAIHKLVSSQESLKNNPEIATMFSGCDPTTEPDCLGFSS